jgi:glutamine amidotransferase
VITVVDYGVNNVRSVVRAVEAAGHDSVVTRDADLVRRADRVLLPGVGHFGQAAKNLALTGLADAVREVATAGRPLLGICLGMQLCFAGSEEAPGAHGLGLVPGHIRHFGNQLPVPHVGWARVDTTVVGDGHPLTGPAFAGREQYFYHVHSFRAAEVPSSMTLATAEYAGEFPTIIARGNVAGFQFHPEKSQAIGIRLLQRFAEWNP